MAGHDYGYRSGYSNGKGVGTRPNDWGKTSYTDEECRTVIVDADGTRRTIIGCTPIQKSGGYVTKTETIITERVLTPVYPAAYKHSSPPITVEPVKEYGYADDKWRKPSSPVEEYGYADDKWRRPSSPVKGYGYAADDHKLRRPSSPVKGYGYAPDDHKLQRPSSPVKGYGYASDDHRLRRPSSPVKGYGYGADDHKLQRPSSPVKGYGYASHDDHRLRRPSSPERDYPQEVGHFLTKVQTEASRDQPSRIGPFNGVNGRQPPQQTGLNGSTTAYGDHYSDYDNKTSYKPNGNTVRKDNYDDYQARPNMTSNGGRPVRPIPSTFTPPPDREGRLTSATDDIETALRYLKESARAAPATTNTPQYSPYSAAPRRDEYQYPTDAAKRNVRFRP